MTQYLTIRNDNKPVIGLTPLIPRPRDLLNVLVRRKTMLLRTRGITRVNRTIHPSRAKSFPGLVLVVPNAPRELQIFTLKSCLSRPGRELSSRIWLGTIRFRNLLI